VIIGVTDSGAPTPQWLAMLRLRLPAEKYQAVAGSRRPLTDEERACARLSRAHASQWEFERAQVEQPYEGVKPPGPVSVVIGNQAAPGDDAFTHDETTIGFDLGELYSTYGNAGEPLNASRIDRFFRHEYAHLVQRAWLTAHPWPAGSALSDALLEIWKEGLGNYHSLTARWRTDDGAPSDVAKETLASLEPRFAARLAALACATPEQATALTSDLSRGPFERKWGALPVALWLATEPGDPKQTLTRFVQAGPAGVWDLAERRLPAPLSAAVREARQAGQTCSAPATTQVQRGRAAPTPVP
jgi:hypothetical protein